jgi:hypothetical protein
MDITNQCPDDIVMAPLSEQSMDESSLCAGTGSLSPSDSQSILPQRYHLFLYMSGNVYTLHFDHSRVPVQSILSFIENDIGIPSSAY